MATMAIDMEQWVKNLLAAWTSHDVEKILTFYTDDCIYEDVFVGNVVRGKKELRGLIDDTLAGSPNLRIEMKSAFASGDHVCTEWLWVGTQSGNWPGIPATGKSYSIRTVAVMELNEGRIRQHTDYYDGASLMRQLGLLPPAMAVYPEIGTWKFDPSKTKVTGPASPQERSSTVTIEPQGDSIKFTWDAINAEGQAIHGEFVGKYDGKDYPVTGAPGIDTVAMKKIDPNTVDYLWKKSGKEILSERNVISKDGKTAALTARGKNAQGQDYTVVMFWEKQ